ncbi:MAG: GspE/PulE family protein [Sphingomonas sp.]
MAWKGSGFGITATAAASPLATKSGQSSVAPGADAVARLVGRHQLLNDEALARARLIQAETGERFQAIINRLGLVSEHTLGAAIAADSGLALLTAADLPQVPVPGADPTAMFLRDAGVLPVAMVNGRLRAAFADPFDDFAAHALGFAYGAPVDRMVALPSDIEAAIDRLYGGQSAGGEGQASAADETDVERLRDMVSDAPVIRAVNRLIAEAVEAKASDIHIEPTDDSVMVRFRVDGVLVAQPALPPAMRSALVSRLKVMAGLNIAERRLPQDGRLRIAIRGNDVDLRVATAPSIHGETAVMRILDRANLALDFPSLGFAPALEEQLRAVLARPHGIVLVTGPTGSGKTTTLYAALEALNIGTRKILTIEDPIEYRLPGIVQMQVNASIGLGFASALRSFLRQDPDVMMVGEVRDLETAQIAVQAALTGHTILATLHTNTAIGAIARLVDMAVEPFLLGATLNAVLSQRLVRRLCAVCRVAYRPAARELAALGIADDATAPMLHSAAGCASCRHTGYAGRLALVEMLLVTETIAGHIVQRADARDIAEQAAREGALSTLRADGIAKVLAGETTVAEVLRVSVEG